MKEKKIPPTWYILKTVKIVNGLKESITKDILHEIFVKLFEEGVMTDWLYSFQEGPYGKSSLDFQYDLESLIQSEELRSHPIELTKKGTDTVPEWEDKKFEKEVKNIVAEHLILP